MTYTWNFSAPAEEITVDDGNDSYTYTGAQIPLGGYSYTSTDFEEDDPVTVTAIGYETITTTVGTATLVMTEMAEVSILNGNSTNYLIKDPKARKMIEALEAAIYGDIATIVAAAIDGKLSDIFPVGSVYIGTQATCPMASLISGSSWSLVSAGKALWTGNGQAGSGTTPNANFANAKANTTIAAGLPDHKHAVSKQYGTTDQASGNGVDGTSHNVGTMSFTCGKASADNSIYGTSTTVQPPAYVVNVWRRTA